MGGLPACLVCLRERHHSPLRCHKENHTLVWRAKVNQCTVENASRRGGTNNTKLYCLYIQGFPFPLNCTGLKRMSPAGSYLGQPAQWRIGALTGAGGWTQSATDQRLSRWRNERTEKLVLNIQNIASQPSQAPVDSNYALLLAVVNLIFPQDKKGYSLIVKTIFTGFYDIPFKFLFTFLFSNKAPWLAMHHVSSMALNFNTMPWVVTWNSGPFDTGLTMILTS